MAIFLVHLLRRGPEWDPSKPMEEQTGWTEHAAFMDDLTENELHHPGWTTRRRGASGPRDRGRIGGRHPRDARHRPLERIAPSRRQDRGMDDPPRRPRRPARRGDAGLTS